MRNHPFVLLLTALLSSLVFSLLRIDCTRAQESAAGQRAVPQRKSESLRHSSGEYMGHNWHIDQDHLMWWDDKPYVRFGFTGNGDLPRMLKAGFDQFTLSPAEDWPISGPDPKLVHSVKDHSDQLEKAGATYYGGLNTLWPWGYGNLIAESDKAAVFVRDVRNVTEHSGRELALDLYVRLPIPKAEQDRVKSERTHAVLFDLDHGARHDLGDQVESVTPIDTEPGREASRGEEYDRRNARAYRVRFKSIRLPESTSLRLVLAMEVRLAELPGVNGLPALWKPGIREFYRRSLEAFRPAYARPGLRGLMFGDEINAFPMSLLTSRSYLDLRRDAGGLAAYQKWLEQRFGGIEQLNRHLGGSYTSFDQVDWVVPLHPFAPELACTDADAEREESWAGAKTAWGLAPTAEHVRKISQVQEEFRQWFCGHWLAEYAKLAKEVIGPVPVFVCSAGIAGEADGYLAMHRWALREGVDGLIRNHYGQGGKEDRHTLVSLARWLADVQQESGCTKHLWANEVGYVRPDVTDAERVAAEAADPGSGGSFGSEWAFPSQESLREMVLLLNQYGYRGFNRFLMSPSSSRAAREVEWMAKLRPEIVSLVVKTKDSPPAATPITRDQATVAARRNPRVEQLLRGVDPIRTTAEFSNRWNVWLVTFLSGDRRIAFASVSNDGEVLEVGSPETEEQPHKDRN